MHDEQVFTFSASSDKLHAATHCMRTTLKSVPRVSKTAVLFGPNGSGKSNLLRALFVMRDLVLHSTTLSGEEFAERYAPFLLDQTQGSPTGFEIDVLLGAMRYQYSFSYTRERICSEKLLAYSTGKSQRWFERNSAAPARSESWAPFSSSFAGPKGLWRNATRPQALFLTTAAQLNSEQLRPLFDWFEHGIAFVFGTDAVDPEILASCIEDDTRKSLLLDFLNSAGIHVGDVRLADAAAVAPPEFDHRPQTPKRRRSDFDQFPLEYSHRRDDGSSVWLQATDESAGVQRLMQVFVPLLTAAKRGQLLLIDEFDLSLHPLVARYLIQLMNDASISPRGAQMLLTSHNTTLMDMDILRRDEIWLMQLDQADSSHLLRMWRSSSPPRKHESIGKQYLIGRYGAVPDIVPARRAGDEPRPQPHKRDKHWRELVE